MTPADRPAQSAVRSRLSGFAWLIVLLGGQACLAPPVPEPRAPEPEPQAVPPTAVSEETPVALEVLLRARWVALPEPPPTVSRQPQALVAFAELVERGDPLLFARLEAEGSPAGRLIGLAGLWHTSPRLYVARRELTRERGERVRIAQGLRLSSTTVREALADGRLDPLTRRWRDWLTARERASQRLLAERGVADWARALAAAEGEDKALPRAALVQLGPRAVEPLVALLVGDELADREASAEALAWIGPEAAAAVPPLLAAIDRELAARPDAALRRAVALGSFGPWARPALPRLRRLASEPPLDGPIARRQIESAIAAIAGP